MAVAQKSAHWGTGPPSSPLAGRYCRRDAPTNHRHRAVLAALAGEWLGHSLNYIRVAGLAGLQAGLTTGVHEYMVPLGLTLLVGAAATATMWTRAWLALGARLDRSVARIHSLLHGAGADPVAGTESASRPIRRDGHTRL